MTLKELKQKLRLFGMTATCRDGEYRVNFQGAPEAVAYYTDCPYDALDTARMMLDAKEERDRKRSFKDDCQRAYRRKRSELGTEEAFLR